MELRNYTPFPTLAYQALDQYGVLYHVVTMRQTLTLQPDALLKYADEQRPLVVADEYFDEMNRSSVRQESDFAPFKPKCDLILVATAYAPGGKPVPMFSVRLRRRSGVCFQPKHPAHVYGRCAWGCAGRQVRDGER